MSRMQISVIPCGWGPAAVFGREMNLRRVAWALAFATQIASKARLAKSSLSCRLVGNFPHRARQGVNPAWQELARLDAGTPLCDAHISGGVSQNSERGCMFFGDSRLFKARFQAVPTSMIQHRLSKAISIRGVDLVEGQWL